MTWVRVAIAVILVAVLGQVVVPSVVDSRAATALHQVTGAASQDHVALTAVPFWVLASGQIEALTISVAHATLPFDGQPLRLSRVRLSWVNGQIDMGALLQQGRFVPDRVGHMTVTLAADGPALAQFLDESGRVTNARVQVGPHYVTLAGTVRLGALAGPITTEGTLHVSANQQELIFVPRTLDGFSLPVAASLPVLDIAALNLPLPLRLTTVKLAPPNVVITAVSP